MPLETPDALDSYYKSLTSLPLPSADQERRWFQTYEKMSPSPKRARLKGEIALGYTRFVIQEALKRSKERPILSDLIGEGNIGLLEAIDKFEVARGWRFLTYAAWWINVRMQGFQHGNRPVHVPQQILKALRAKKKKEDLEMAQGLRSSYSFLEVTTTDIEKVAVTAPVEEAPEELSEGKTMDVLRRAGLTTRERFVMTWFFGLRGGNPKNLDEIANLLMVVDGGAVTRDDVRELKDEAVIALKDFLKREEIEGVWDL